MSEAQQSSSRVEARRYNVERSCIRCHQRKTRCDRKTPCSACLKSENADACLYPGSERVKRRSRKQLTTTLVQQVEKLERIVSSKLEQEPTSDRDKQTARDSSTSPEQISGVAQPETSSSNATGLLVKDGNFVQYVNDRVLSHILEKVRFTTSRCET